MGRYKKQFAVRSKNCAWSKIIHINSLGILLLLLDLCCFSFSLLPSDNAVLCSAIPSYFTWSLDFALTCEPANIKYGEGTGVARYACQIYSTGPDRTPVYVHTAQIIELNNFLRPVVATKLINLNLTNGDDLSYTSVGVSDPNIVLGGMSIKLTGVNSLGAQVDLSWTIQYSNSSNTNEIVFSLGDSLGWTNFVSSNAELPYRLSTCLLVFCISQEYNEFGASFSPKITTL